MHLIGGKSQKRYFSPDPDDEVWGLNTCRFTWVDGKWTSFFNIHKYENLRRYGYDIEADVRWLRDRPKIMFYTVDPWPELQTRNNVRVFPWPMINSALAAHRCGYHCGSFDWMMAYATALNFDRIVIHGVSLLIEAGEPISARACLEYWCGVAEARGVGVMIAPDCDLFAFYHLVKSNMIYGFDDTPIYEDRTGTAVAGEAPYKVPEPTQ